jgi:hypothetical protein
MKIIITEHQSKRLKRILREQEIPTVKLSLNASSLLDNNSETFNKKIGVKVLPSCFSTIDETQKVGIYDNEIDTLVDLLDWPMTSDSIQSATQWAQGSGFPGSFGGNGNFGNLNRRVVNENGLWYPAVEELRVRYNLDEYFEDLGGISKKKELVEFRNSLIKSYQYWIDCVNKKIQY